MIVTIGNLLGVRDYMSKELSSLIFDNDVFFWRYSKEQMKEIVCSRMQGTEWLFFKDTLDYFVASVNSADYRTVGIMLKDVIGLTKKDYAG